ncbi:MAG TPA: acyltransferase [Bryobacteraceae bacterium]|nr:acyltransferase [Bryobacteraceae bacterium]
MEVDRHYLPTLDGWRAVAILAVLCCHAGWPTAAIAPYGAMGVSVFFALSGFLITRRLIDARRVDLADFYRRRAFRILPPILVYLAVVALLGFGLRLIPMDRSQLLGSLLFYRNYLTLGRLQGWYTGHFWSLAVEEHFYLFWPVLLWMAGFRRARWLAPALALAVAVWRTADAHYDWVGRFNPALRGSVARSDYRLDILLFGCTLALLWDDRRVRALFERFGGSALAIGAMAIAVCCQVWTPPAYLTLVAIAMALLPAATVASRRSWVGRVLELRLLVWIGRMSYSLYIWQQLFLPPEPIGIWQRAPWNLAAIFACAAASYYLVERPAMALGRPSGSCDAADACQWARPHRGSR